MQTSVLPMWQNLAVNKVKGHPLMNLMGCHIEGHPEGTAEVGFDVFGYYTLRSVTVSGQYKYRTNPSACNIAEESACTTGDSACKLIFLYL